MTEQQQTHRTAVIGEGDDALTYDVHGDLATATAERPPLFVFGSPMDAVGFGTLAGLIADRPVVTYDPRGSGRNPTGTSDLTPEQHADDLHRVVDALGAGPVDAFGSSGGAVNALAFAAAHPDDVRRVVAHEPPLADPLPDRDAVLAALDDIKQTYAAAGEGPAMARFIGLVMQDGELSDDYVDQPAPDPASFGMPTEDDGARTNPLIRNMPACNEYRVDVPALTALGDRVVVAVGATSGEEMAARGGRAVAGLLGQRAVELPGGHAGFSGGEYGQPAGEPEAFAAALLRLLD
jgi:pimeloyl-ACP methyl ester carboxylesterase